VELPVGECFVLGFRGRALPAWLRDFESELGLGGVVLFDWDAETRRAERNVESPAQLRALCAELHALPSRPLVFVDQEGGRVRRLKQERGFAPLPSARELAALPEAEARAVAAQSFAEMRALGIDYDLAPVVDLDLNPANPNIGALGRAFSADPAEVARCARLLGDAAREAGLGLCLKHWPGLGGAGVDTHLGVADLSDDVCEPQLALFDTLAAELPGRAVLLSHGVVRQWQPDRPVSVSPAAVRELRRRAGDVLLLTDDLQMQGLQAFLPTRAACVEALRAGVDLVLLGNNLLRQEDECVATAREVARAARAGEISRENLEAAWRRIRERKRALSDAALRAPAEPALG
jgi:beta-N-acetylhexosaminidase